MRTSIATISIGGSLEVKLRAIAQAGFDGVEIMDADLVATHDSPATVRARCADLGLAVEILQPIRDVVGVAADTFPNALRRVRQRLHWANELGAPTVLVCSTVGAQAVENRDLLVDQLAAVGDAAAEAGIVVAYEALSWGTYVNRVGQTWDAVRELDHPQVGIAVDTFHICAAHDGVSALEGIPGDKIAFLQIADAPYLEMSALEWSRHHRCFPGQGNLDLTGLVGAVLDAGYDGPLSLEVFSDIVREADPLLTARDALRSLRFLQDGLAQRGVTRSAGATAPQLPRLPRAAVDPRPVGVEIAAPAGSDVGRTLDALGFERIRAAEPVEQGPASWRLGEATVTVSPTDRALVAPRVAGITLAVPDPDALRERAADLLWPIGFSRSSWFLTTPAGVRVDVCRAADAAVPSVSGVDHLGTVVPPTASDAEVSFYRQLFAMEAGPVSEFPDPLGRLRSRDLRASGQGALRAVLNIEVGGLRDQGPGVNQLAFRCVDLLQRVSAMRAAGAPLIRPGNGYYDDLAARFGLDEKLLIALRDGGVFYDRDEHGGELVHVYTPLIGGTFYLELLERLGGYEGYGATATPVRLALQSSGRDRDVWTQSS